MKIEPLQPEFAGAVTGVRIDGPPARGVVDSLKDALDRYSLLVFHDTALDDERFVALGRSFGELEDFAFGYGTTANISIGSVSNLDAENRIRKTDDAARLSMAANALWHTDGSYRKKRTRYSMLVARILPKQGGNTEFCDTRRAYDALPEPIKHKLEGLVGLHSIIHSRKLLGYTAWTDEQRAMLPPIPQPLVLQNPRTGRRSLYLASHIGEIIGWSEAETMALVRELTDFATQPLFVYAHEWRENDLVIWDNQATMHRGMAYDDLNEVRVLATVRVIDPEPFSSVVS